MKLKYLLLLFTVITIVSCGKKEKPEETGSWKELDTFHTIMAEAFHPLKDSGNVEPATRMMDQLATEAEKWAAAPLPEKVNTPEMKEMLNKLKTDLRKLSDDIKTGAPEDQIGTTFFDIHDQFHKIMETWNGEKGEEHEHH
jgi:hypothetical protein